MAGGKGLHIKSDVSPKTPESIWLCSNFQEQVRRTAGASVSHLQLLHYFGIFLEITKHIFLSRFHLPPLGSWLKDYMQSLRARLFLPISHFIFFSGIFRKGRLETLTDVAAASFIPAPSKHSSLLAALSRRKACEKKKKKKNQISLQKVENSCFI